MQSSIMFCQEKLHAESERLSAAARHVVLEASAVIETIVPVVEPRIQPDRMDERTAAE